MKNKLSTWIMFAVLPFHAMAAENASPVSSIIPVQLGRYAPTEGGCDAPAAALIFIEKAGIASNKTKGTVVKTAHSDNLYTLQVLWIEEGSDRAEGVRDTVTIEVKDPKSFVFSNSFTEKTPMEWCE